LTRIHGPERIVRILEPKERCKPLNTWFRDQMEEVHGVDISQGAPRATNVHDIRL
jgi:hypothetical protein